MNYIELSKESLKKEVKKLYDKVKKNYEYDCVVFIAKGAFLIGKDLAYYQNVPLLEVFATRKGNKFKKILRPLLKAIPRKIKKTLREKEVTSSYHQDHSKRFVSFDEEIWKLYRNSKRILLVDDSVDTGNTIQSVYENIKEYFSNSEIKIACLNMFEKSKCKCKIDYYLYENSLINGPWSNDSKEYKNFYNEYQLWHSFPTFFPKRVSVAMATYNGEKYIKEQISSILKNLKENDELIISDDGSKDDTLEIIRSFEDPRIVLLEGPRKGIKQNFANAISNCSGKYIFLSDQDDYWKDNKIDIVLQAFQKYDALLVQHDCSLIQCETKAEILPSFFEFRKCGPGVTKNIVKTTFLGCCMAFDARMKEVLLPIPDNIDMHDQWIGVICEHYKKSVFISDKLIEYRRHEGTASDCFHHYPISKMLRNRIVFIKKYRERIRKK